MKKISERVKSTTSIITKLWFQRNHIIVSTTSWLTGHITRGRLRVSFLSPVQQIRQTISKIRRATMPAPIPTYNVVESSKNDEDVSSSVSFSVVVLSSVVTSSPSSQLELVVGGCSRSLSGCSAWSYSSRSSRSLSRCSRTLSSHSRTLSSHSRTWVVTVEAWVVVSGLNVMETTLCIRKTRDVNTTPRPNVVDTFSDAITQSNITVKHRRRYRSWADVPDRNVSFKARRVLEHVLKISNGIDVPLLHITVEWTCTAKMRISWCSPMMCPCDFVCVYIYI